MLEESKELKRRKLEEENRKRLEEEQEHLRQLDEELKRKQAEASDTDQSNTQSHIRYTDKVRQGIERRRYLNERRQRRKSGENVESTTSEESLTAPFRNITKVLGRMNRRYPDEVGREENDQLIGDINDRAIRDAFRKGLRPDEEAIEERLTSVLSHFLADVERKQTFVTSVATVRTMRLNA
jgi:hypothetical protein